MGRRCALFALSNMCWRGFFLFLLTPECCQLRDGGPVHSGQEEVLLYIVRQCCVVGLQEGRKEKRRRVFGEAGELKHGVETCCDGSRQGSTVEECEGGFKFGPDSTGSVVQAEGEGAAEWVKALKGLTEGKVEEEEYLRKGWLTREKKKFFFTLSNGYLTWYQKEPNPSIPHNKNFVKELTLNSCTVSVSGTTVNVNKTTKTDKKTEEKVYPLVAADAADAAAWAEALTKSASAAEEQVWKLKQLRELGELTGEKRGWERESAARRVWERG